MIVNKHKDDVLVKPLEQIKMSKRIKRLPNIDRRAYRGLFKP